MADSVKVPEDQFKAVIRALLTAAPIPASSITTKRTWKDVAKKPSRNSDTSS